jgi:hypothetical protein
MMVSVAWGRVRKSRITFTPWTALATLTHQHQNPTVIQHRGFSICPTHVYNTTGPLPGGLLPLDTSASSYSTLHLMATCQGNSPWLIFLSIPYYLLFPIHYSLIPSTFTGSFSSDVVDSRPQNLRVLQAGIILSIGPTFPLTLPLWLPGTCTFPWEGWG